jgi:glutathione S-transferase
MCRRDEERDLLKLWGRINSINVQKVSWALAELALPHERIDAGMAFGKVGEPWFRAMNPNGTVPVIDDGGVIVWESNAILRYLAGRYAPGRLIATDTAGRASAEMWMDWQQTAIMSGMNPLFIGLIRTPPEKRDAAALEAARVRVEAGLMVLDAHLHDRAFVASPAFGVADIALGVVAYRWKALPITRPPTPNLDRWYASLAARPAFQDHVMLPLT